MIKEMVMIDWRAIKSYHKRIPMVLLFGFLVGIFWSAPLVIPSCAMMSLLFSINIFAVEEKGELNKLYLTLPIERNSIVAGRFVLSLIMGACGMIAGIPVMILTNAIGYSHYYYPLSWNIFIFAFAYLFFSFCNIATYPLLFRYGYSKGKVWGFYLPLIVISILYGIFQIVSLQEEHKTLLLDVLEFASGHVLIVSGGITLLATLLLLLSFILSKYLYNKREF